MTDDDFDIESLAAYLHLQPEQIRKMADRGRLPGRRVGGDWKFSQAEIHHWFEEKIGASSELELIEVEKVLDRQTVATDEDIRIAELLNADRICVPLAARTRNSVIERICEFAADSGALWMPREMADAIRSREEMHSTALENGVALLHSRRPQPSLFGESFVALGITSTGIPFGGPRGCLTDLFFLIASADESIHLRTLARLSRMICLPELLQKLREATDSGAAHKAVVDAENGIQQ